MKGLKPFLYLLLGCLVCAILNGCAAGTPQNGPSALNIAQINLAQGVPGLSYRQLMIASGGVQPYTWSIGSGSLPAGLTITSDGIISGTPTTIGTANFVVKVVDSQTPTAAVSTQSFSIVINAPLSLSALPLPNGLVGSTYSTSITAANGVQPYTYTIASGTLPPCAPTPPCTNGLMTLATQPPPMGGGPNSGTISTPNGSTLSGAGIFYFTIQATDNLGEVATATYSITITGRLQGGYTFSFNGFASDLPVYFAGSFIADGNGNITSGVIDQAGPGSSIATAVPLEPSTYNIPMGVNIASITLKFGSKTYGLSVTLSTTSDSIFILTNSSIYGSGVLRKQTTTSLSPNVSSYAFGMFGNDTGGARYAGAGMFKLSSLNVSGGAEDTNDNGTASSELAITGGSISNPDATTGRGTLSLVVMVNGQPVTYGYAYYTTALLTNQLVAIGTDTSAPQVLVTLLPQTAVGAGHGFDNGNLVCSAPNACSVMQLNAVTSAGPDASVGAVTFDGDGNITRSGIDTLPGFFTDESNAGTASQNSYNGTYNVDSNCGTVPACGRVTVTFTDLQGNPIPDPPVWYLVTKNQGFVVGTDAAVTSGQFVPQTGAPFTIASLLGSYLGGTLTPATSSITNEIDVAATPPPGGVWAEKYSSNGPGGLIPQMGQLLPTFSGPYAFDPTYGTNFGRFTISTDSGKTVFVVYITGTGAAGATGGKAGLLGLNLGQYDGTADPNPRLTTFGR